MEWIVVAALAILVLTFILVLYQAASFDNSPRDSSKRRSL